MPITTIGLDADDTLWESEVHFVDVQQRFRELIARYDPSEDIQKHLYSVQRHNLELFGYGVKSFTLSMIETAIQLTDGAVDADDVGQIVSWCKEMMVHPVQLLEGVSETVRQLSSTHQVLIVTKGDLLHQEAKVAQSGLAELVHGVEVLVEKDPPTYQRMFDRRQIRAENFLMVGNSVRSDVLPVLKLGGHAVYIPYGLTWEHEEDHDGAPDLQGHHVAEQFADLPALVSQLDAVGAP